MNIRYRHLLKATHPHALKSFLFDLKRAGNPSELIGFDGTIPGSCKGVTVCVLEPEEGDHQNADDGRIMGVTFCSSDDQFDKQEGRTRAYDRAFTAYGRFLKRSCEVALNVEEPAA